MLLLDDEATLLAALERQFRSAGLHPLSTTTIDDAWRILDSWVVHAVVSDERLNEGSGAYFLIDVGRKFRGIGRVLLSGYMEPYLAALAQENEFAALDKSVSFSDLLAAVKREIGTDG